MYPQNPEVIIKTERKNSAKAEGTSAIPIDPAELARCISLDILREKAPDKGSKRVKVQLKDKRNFEGWEIAQQADLLEQGLREKEAAI